jgi:hypothetical protein
MIDYSYTSPTGKYPVTYMNETPDDEIDDELSDWDTDEEHCDVGVWLVGIQEAVD